MLFYFFVSFFRLERKLIECGYWGSEEAGWANLATVDADEETLDFRVGRIEENPRGCLQFGAKKNGRLQIGRGCRPGD